jgi:hypothetical protein
VKKNAPFRENVCNLFPLVFHWCQVKEGGGKP